MEISDYAQAEIYAERAKKKYLKNSKKKGNDVPNTH